MLFLVRLPGTKNSIDHQFVPKSETNVAAYFSYIRFKYTGIALNYQSRLYQ